MTELQRFAEWTVPREEIDHLGHMSTLFYAHRADQGVVRLLERLGADANRLAGAGLVMAVVDRHIHFRREQLAGAHLALAGGVVTANRDQIDVYQELGRIEPAETAAVFRSSVQLRDRATRKPASIPAAWLDAAELLQIEPPENSQPRTLSLDQMGAELTIDDFVRAGVTSHVRREITAELCDEDGFLTPRPPSLVATAGPYNSGVMDKVWTAAGRGFAWPALEVRSLELRTSRRGDQLETFTALLSVGRKIIHSGTWVFEARTGALTSLMHMVNVHFDLSARRTKDMPTRLHEQLTSLSTPRLIGSQAQMAG